LEGHPLSFESAIAEIERIDKKAVKLQTSCGPAAKMTWRRWGEGRPLILLHGGAGSWLHWIRNIETLSRGRSVWVPDMPGFGDSDLPAGPHDADALAPFVLDGINQLVKGRFDLVGFSFGALVASLIAAEQPSELDQLVLVSGASIGLVAKPPALKSLRGTQTAAERAEVFRSNLHTLMLSNAASIDDLAVLVQEHASSRERAKNRKLALTDILLRLTPKWRCAACGIWGLQDAIYRDRVDELKRIVASLGLRDAIFLQDAGHWLQYERADEFNGILPRLLEQPVKA